MGVSHRLIGSPSVFSSVSQSYLSLSLSLSLCLSLSLSLSFFLGFVYVQKDTAGRVNVADLSCDGSGKLSSMGSDCHLPRDAQTDSQSRSAVCVA